MFSALHMGLAASGRVGRVERHIDSLLFRVTQSRIKQLENVGRAKLY